MSPNMPLILLVSLLLTTVFTSAFADGAAIALNGNGQGAPACFTCHGAPGEGPPANGFPRLTGLSAGYLQTQLNAFANGQRQNAMMTPIAQTLSEKERVEVARYFSGLGGSRAAVEAAPVMTSLGEQLAIQGRWSQGLPSCTHCHGTMGAGVGPVFPALAGQSSLYLENQLRAWQQGTRAPGPLGLMSLIASKLSDADIKAVAAYFSSLPTKTPSLKKTP